MLREEWTDLPDMDSGPSPDESKISDTTVRTRDVHSSQ
jgi:hypothetical protein